MVRQRADFGGARDERPLVHVAVVVPKALVDGVVRVDVVAQPHIVSQLVGEGVVRGQAADSGDAEAQVGPPRPDDGRDAAQGAQGAGDQCHEIGLVIVA